jgi:TatD DNase family protein
MLIETHAHLDYPDFASDLDDVLRRATEAGVTRIITIGTSVESSRRAVNLAEKHSNIYAVIGVHPTYAQEAEDERDDAVTRTRQKPARRWDWGDWSRLSSFAKRRGGKRKERASVRSRIPG